jgi:peptidoglycan hydrolase-like protein with peptidoglycan-binding domain
MNLQGRNLEPNLRGDDVKLLQSELRQLKLKTQIVDQEGFFGSTTFLAVQEFQRLNGLNSTGIVDEQTASAINKRIDESSAARFVVRGEVTQANSEPLSGAVVRLSRKGLRRDEPIAQATTSPTGVYSIEYQPAELPISIVVQAFGSDGKAVATSGVICKARPVEIVNLRPDGAPSSASEFKRLQDRLTPILNREQLRVDALDADDVELLACAHDFDAEHLSYLVVSSRMARESKLDAEVFYGLVRQGQPVTLVALVAQDPEVLREALEDSVDENIVGQAIKAQIPRILRDLQAQVVRLAVADSDHDRATLRTLFEIAGVPQQRQQTLVTSYIDRKGTVAEFWADLREQRNGNAQEIDSLQYTVGTASITLNHAPLIQQLARMRSAGQLGPNLRDLARFKQEDWLRLIKTQAGNSRVGAPATFGQKEDERETRYAEFLPRMVEALYPTAVLTHRLAEIDEETFAPALQFLRKNPDFEFQKMQVNEFLKANPQSIDDGPDRERTISQLRSVQRMMNIAPQFGKAQVVSLIKSNIDSAFQIRRMGPAQFIRSHAQQLGGAATAEQVYTNAARHSDTTLILLSQSKFFNPTSPGIIAPHLFGEGVPDLEALFGSLDLCQCDHCSSVYSPAAYLVDILHFLMNRRAKTPSQTALDILFGDPDDAQRRRRWDIGEIELTCRNTNTALPHIDLVNEILEQAIAPSNTFPFQTASDSDALGANPEHTNTQAYTILGNAVFPWTLPFNLFAAEARSYLAQLGIRREVLMEEFRSEGAPPLPIDIAAEYLGLTSRERSIINGSAGETTRQMWGMSQAEFNQLLNDRPARVVLERSGLTYEELVELFDVPLIGGSMRVQFAEADCNLDTATITNLNTQRLDRMHRFARLQRKLGWPIAELGDTFAALGINSLTDDALTELASVKHVREAITASLETILTWWSARIGTETNDQPSLYDRIFNDPTVNPPVVDVFRLNPGRTELLNPNLLIADHVTVVSTALGVSSENLSLLLPGLATNRLNLANLTSLYKTTTFARALKLQLSDLNTLRAITGMDPFTGPAATESFATRTRLVRESGFDLATLDYLLRHRTSESIDNQAVEFTSKLHDGLLQIATDHEFATDPMGVRTAESLSRLLPLDIVNRGMAILNLTSIEDKAAQTALINEHFTAFLDTADAVQQLVNPGTLDTPAERFDYVLQPLLVHLSRLASEALVVEACVAAFGVTTEVSNVLVRELVRAPNNPADPVLLVLLETVESPVQIEAFHRLSKIGIILKALNISSEHVAFTIARGASLGWLDLNDLPLTAQETSGPLFDRWLAMVTLFRASLKLPNANAALFAIFAHLDNDQLTLDQFLDLLAQHTAWNRADIAFLTSTVFNLEFPAGFADGRFLIRLKRCFELLTAIGVAAAEVLQWVTPAPAANVARSIKQAVRGKFDDRADWLAAAKPIRDELRKQQRSALVAHLLHTVRIVIPVFESPQPQLQRNARRPAVEELQLRLNAAGANPKLDADGIFGRKTETAVIEFQEANSLNADGIVGPNTWAVLNQVRQRLNGTNDLYAHFLVDVEMEPCMLTSRIVLATNSVQLFVQRCLLNLEPQVDLTPEDAKEWAWMKNYRVWEANRKVFLYPENWIEPELRDDKTPFFVGLEHGLLQDEVNDTTVEREYLKYLRELDRVARLEPCGIYRQWEVDRDILHVVARTRTTPHLYYYRQWVDQKYWTAWEPIDADIEGDHFVPVVWNRRLYLFWPMFMEKAVEIAPSDTSDRAPKRFFEIRLAWSEYRDGEWSPKQVSDVVVTTPEAVKLPDKNAFSFWSFVNAKGELVIAHEITDAKQHQAVARQQFRFTSAGAAPELARSGTVDSSPPPGTTGLYNAFKEKGEKPFRLVVSSIKGDTYPVKVETDSGPDIAILFTSEDILLTSNSILQQTPGSFHVLLAHDERPHRSQASLFYYDENRTFFVAPHGKYAGGFGGGLDKVADELKTAPLELPDVLSNQAVLALASSNAGPVSTRAAGAGRIGNILSPQVSLARSFQPMRWEAKHFRFDNFYHPFVNLLIEQLNRFGIEGVLKPDADLETNARRAVVAKLRRQQNRKIFFNSLYKPNSSLVLNVFDMTPVEKSLAGPWEEFDFDYGTGYSVYNWELFFHAPFMIAKRLGSNQRFAEAHKWFQYIFDPTDNSTSEQWPERVWQIKPFFEHGQGKSIERMMLLLKSSGLTNAEQQERKSLNDQIDAWRKSPFNPHLIARMRPEAYMKTTVMAYLDNLIAWGDQLFRQDTRESVNEATQLYLLASEILGERPKEIPAHEGVRRTIDGEEVNTFNQLRGRLDAFSNVLIDLETVVHPMDNQGGGAGGIKGLLGPQNLTLGLENGDGDLVPDLPLAQPGIEPPDNGFVLDKPLATPIPAILGPTLFFCIPKNDKLLGYWNTVADRLFKIRHCLNIEGVARQLALFAPPIDPGLLVKAAAAGLDIGSVLSNLNAPLPHYRFQTLVQKANEVVGDVKSLGAELLSTLEKKDAEALALLRSTQETQVLEAMRDLKQRLIDEAVAARDALETSKKVLEERATFYETREMKSFKEQHNLDKLEEAQSYQLRSNAIELVRSALGLLPDFDIGIEGFASSPTVKANWGGSNILAYMGALAQAFAMDAEYATHEAGKALTESGYERRQEDWDFQASQARTELSQLQKQIAAANIRIDIAEQELKNHDLQVENAKAADEFMRSKYTNQELYGWMLSQISAVYFQSFQFARDMASRAERAFQYEMGVTVTDFIQPGLWDNLKKGLMAGHQLQFGLRRMEAAYLDQNRREYELTKHVSLAMLDPMALITLRETGECFVDLPEALFDMDYPGHFQRRIKSVSLTIPCVVGPYSTINCTLTMLSNSVRSAANPSAPYARNNGDDPRFLDNLAAIQSIVTSGAQNDSGMFELNLRDERFLPFEGAGAISRWRIQLPLATNRFDRNTISDVIVHLRYTAREGGDALRTAALPPQTGGARLLSLKNEFATAWHRFLNAEADVDQLMLLQRMDERFPFRRRGVTITLNRVVMIARFASNNNYTVSLAPLVNNEVPLNPSLALGGLHMASANVPNVDITGAIEWTLRIRRAGEPDAHLEPGEVENFFIVCLYTMSG